MSKCSEIQTKKFTNGGMVKIMGEVIGKVIFVIIALVIIASVGSLILSVLGMVLGLIPLLIKLAVFGGLIYLAWMVIRKLTQSSQTS